MAFAGFAVAGIFILYVLLGYPALLTVLARRRGRPVKRGPLQPSVTIIIAVYNGERFVQEKLRSILDLQYPRAKMQIVVASDGSTDRTEEVVAGFAPDGVELLRLPHRGKTAALNAAMAQAHGEILVFTDIRQIVEPQSLNLLLENFADPCIGAASAELVLFQGAERSERNVGLYWQYELWIRSNLSTLDSIFGATGAYYAMRRELVTPLPQDALLDDMHLPLAAFFRGYRLVVDARAHMFDYPSRIENEFCRKVRTLAGNYQILRAYPQLLGPRNRLWLHFVSYKLARLFLPFALIAMAVCSFGLPSPWGLALLAAQAGAYAAAAADIWIPETWPMKRLTSLLRTFVIFMAAALCAVSVFFLPSNKLWRADAASGTP